MKHCGHLFKMQTSVNEGVVECFLTLGAEKINVNSAMHFPPADHGICLNILGGRCMAPLVFGSQEYYCIILCMCGISCL